MIVVHGTVCQYFLGVLDDKGLYNCLQRQETYITLFPKKKTNMFGPRTLECGYAHVTGSRTLAE